MEVIMDIRRFRIFQKVAEFQSFTKAAQSLYMTQPAVSKAIHELEEELQTPLFERFPKKVILTPEGMLFLKKVTDLLIHYDDVLQHVAEIHSQYTLRIGSSITIANDVLTTILKDVKKIFPLLSIQVEIASRLVITDKLARQQLDIAFVEGMIDQDIFTCIPFSNYHMKAVAHPNLMKNETISTLSDIAKFPLLLREKGSAIRDVVESCFLMHDIPLHPTWTSTNSTALLKAATEGFGIAFLPEKMVLKKLKNHTLQEIYLKELQLVNTNYIVYLKHKHVNEAMHTLIKLANTLTHK